jgi:hypothetical protein
MRLLRIAVVLAVSLLVAKRQLAPSRSAIFAILAALLVPSSKLNRRPDPCQQLHPPICSGFAALQG